MTIILNENLRNISKDEIILFKTYISKVGKRMKYWVIFLIFMLILYLSFAYLGDLLRGSYRFRFFHLLLLLFVVVLLILGYLGGLKLASQAIESLIFTNKRIYKQTGETISIKSVDINKLKAITFQLSKKDKTNQLGTIKIIPEVTIGKNYALKSTGIPNFNEVQKIVESILYIYADIEERWQIIKEKLNIKFPYEIKVSEQIKKNISHRSKKKSIMLIISIMLFFFGLFMFSIVWSQEIKTVMQFLLNVSLFSLGFGIYYIIVIAVQKIGWKKRSSDINSVLTLYSDKITITESNNETSMPLNSLISVDILKIEKYATIFFKWRINIFKIGLNWKEDLDGIIIKPSNNLKDVIKFGPIDKFPEIFEAIFCYILKWKADNGLLLSIEKIQEIYRKTK